MNFLRFVLPGIAMIASTYGLARFSFGLLLPDIQKSLQLSDLMSGTISSLFYLAYCFTITLSTIITIRQGPRKMIFAAGLAALIGLLCMGLAHNIYILGLGVLLAGASTGLVSPPYGAAISLWIEEKKQGIANTWINSGTSIGIILSGLGAILLTPHWRITYFIYAVLTLITLLWNIQIIPKKSMYSTRMVLKKGDYSIKGVEGSIRLSIASVVLGICSAAFWTFSRSFFENAGNYEDWQLSIFWVVIGVLGILGGFSGSLIEKKGLPFSYKFATILLSIASIILALSPDKWFIAYSAAGIFGGSYIFLTGVLLVWGIRVFIHNASLGIGVPFLLLAVGQVIGSLSAGLFIGLWGYASTFILFGCAGLLASFITPKKKQTYESI
ncbi:MFS transporter [Virgibacillus dokdonensis]|uniref:Predicted arabinose efflux permease, MFS family n=3 Tax=Bacillaceae TaxID=186817 RepID=A0A1M5L9P1_9BACI|nr:MFS transporter [Virgibacillus dokdonensis]SHG61696.1 Predicted arabinose efflux permease, MFS family [Virgibacillus chiguensis]